MGEALSGEEQITIWVIDKSLNLKWRCCDTLVPLSCFLFHRISQSTGSFNCSFAHTHVLRIAMRMTETLPLDPMNLRFKDFSQN